jgi:hypothetical protein
MRWTVELKLSGNGNECKPLAGRSVVENKRSNRYWRMTCLQCECSYIRAVEEKELYVRVSACSQYPPCLESGNPSSSLKDANAARNSEE